MHGFSEHIQAEMHRPCATASMLCKHDPGKFLSCSYSNRAAAYLALGMWDEALKDAERARMLAQDALKRTHTAGPLYIKTYAQKGEALIGEARACMQSLSHAPQAGRGQLA